MVTLPAFAPVNVREHEPDARVHLAGLGITLPIPDCESVTVPVGDNPITVAVHVVDEPAGTEDGEQLTKVDEAILSDITETVPEPSFVTNTSPLPES